MDSFFAVATYAAGLGNLARVRDYRSNLSNRPPSRQKARWRNWVVGIRSLAHADGDMTTSAGGAFGNECRKHSSAPRPYPQLGSPRSSQRDAAQASAGRRIPKRSA